MTQTPTNVTPPPDLTYGYVDGRIILAIGDRSDAGRMPDPVPADGMTVTLTPANTILKVASPTPATVVKQPIPCGVDANGSLIDRQAARGVWLVTGTYKVTYSHPRATIPSHDIEVTTGHTEAAPLDLTTAMPPGGPVLTPSEYAELSARIDAMGEDVLEQALALAQTSAQQAAGSRRDLVPVATKCHPPADAATSTSTGGKLGGTAKLNHIATRSFYGVRLVYTNWKSGTANTEQNGANDITVRAAVEPAGNLVIPITFGGNRTVVISPGGTVISDPVGIEVTKGATFSTRTFVQVSTGQTFPINNIPTASSGEGNNYGTTVGADLTDVGAASLTGIGTNQLVFGPAAILGQVIDPDRPVIGILGDSIFNGTGDSSFAFGGLAQRALNNNYSFQKVTFPGEPLTGWLGSSGYGDTRCRRVGLLALVGCTHIVTDYTVNSLATTTIQADAVKAWRVMAKIAPGQVFVTTLTPQTTTTDGWATTGNQAIQYPSDREPRRLAFNAWIRDGAPINASDVPQSVGATGAGIVRFGEAGHPVRSFFEVADLAETARNSGIWKAGYTSDGTHPNATGHAALAAAITPETFGPVSLA